MSRLSLIVLNMFVLFVLKLSCRADWALLVQLCSQPFAVGKGLGKTLKVDLFREPRRGHAGRERVNGPLELDKHVVKV